MQVQLRKSASKALTTERSRDQRGAPLTYAAVLERCCERHVRAGKHVSAEGAAAMQHTLQQCSNAIMRMHEIACQHPVLGSATGAADPCCFYWLVAAQFVHPPCKLVPLCGVRSDTRKGKQRCLNAVAGMAPAPTGSAVVAMVDALKDIHARQRKLLRTEHAHLAHFLQLVAALPAKRRQLQSELAGGLAAAGEAAQADAGDAQMQLAKVEAELGRLRDVREGLSEDLQAGAQAIAELQVRNGGDGG